MTSIDFIEKINNEPKLKSVKIIYLTAVMGAKELAESEENVPLTIEKPFENKQLISIIKKVLK